MTWPEIQTQYPSQWLLVEALKSHAENDKRILDELAVVSSHLDSTTAMQVYTRLHHALLDQDLHVFHTSRETLEVVERQWLGIRVAQ